MATLAPPMPRSIAITLAPMQLYLLAMAAGALLTFGAMVAALLMLQGKDALPPPQFANSVCIDEKLRSMRAGMPADPNLLVVGSSVAWRHFNSPAAVAAAPDLRPLNAGFCGANMVQTRKVSAWLTARLPTVRHVLLIASPLDFERCTANAPSQFDIFDADDYVFRNASPARFYLRYFDPVTLVRNATTIRAARAGTNGFDPVVQNSYGDGPNQPARSRGLFYEGVNLDPACFAALRQTAGILQRKGVSLDVTVTPLAPEWVERYQGAAGAAAFARTIEQSLAGTGARFRPVDYRPGPDAFYDAIHIRWSATAGYTRSLLRETRPFDTVRAPSTTNASS